MQYLQLGALHIDLHKRNCIEDFWSCVNPSVQRHGIHGNFPLESNASKIWVAIGKTDVRQV